MLRLAVLIGLFTAVPARSDCRLALALGMDVSRSVDAADFVIQTEGLATALEAPEIQAAFFGPAGDVALTVYQWSGESYQETVVPWTMIRTAEDLPAVIAMVRRLTPPETRLATALGRGLDYGRTRLAEAPPCARMVLDIAGDGRNNSGPTPERIYGAGGWDGITVNGLAIGSHELQIEDYFRASLIRGPGAFVELAYRHTDFPEAMRRKLLRELTEAVSTLPVPLGGKT